MSKRLLATLQIILGTTIFGIAAILLLDHFGIVETVKTYVVMSGSMEPAVQLGSVVVARPQDTYRPGEIISFAPDGNKDQIVTHRVVFRRYIDSIGHQAVPQDIGSQAETSGLPQEPVYLTSGDANDNLDRWELTSDQIIGRVLFSVPYLGYLVNFAKQPYGFILLVIVPATIVIYEELKYVLRELLHLIRTAKNKLISWRLKSPQLSPRNLSINLLPRKEGKYPQAGVVISTVGAVLVLAAFSGAFYSDEEPSTGNVFSASDIFCNQSEGHVVINELFYDVDSLHNGLGSENNWEWVELYNPTSSAKSLTGWSIGTIGGGGDFEIFSGTLSLAPCSFAIVSPSSEAELENQTNDGGNWTIPDGTLFITLTDFIGDNGLNNGGDNVVLRDNSSSTIDAISYGTDTSQLNPSATDVASGHSLERVPDGIDTDTATDFVDRSTPTPGS